MPADAERQASYQQIRERFLNDPEFRQTLRANPTGTLQAVLGDLTEEERRWTGEIIDSLDQELVERISSGRYGFW
jgi:hypothetical protein